MDLCARLSLRDSSFRPRFVSFLRFTLSLPPCVAFVEEPAKNDIACRDTYALPAAPRQETCRLRAWDAHHSLIENFREGTSENAVKAKFRGIAYLLLIAPLRRVLRFDNERGPASRVNERA